MPYIKSDGKRIVIALGGNALGNTPQEQLELVKHTAACIVDMVAEGNNVIVTHGNGPQVGMINNAFAFASQHDEKTPEMPFPEAGAMSQGYIGYQLSQAILNELRRRGIMRSTANVVTQTVVYPDDPAFQNPTKPVGAFLTEEEAKAKAAETGYTFKEDAGRGWRQVVASPKPRRIVILTAVEKVAINFNTPEQADIDTMDTAKAQEYIEQGQFAPGSMLPKVEACLEYVGEYPQGKALITSLDKAKDAINGLTGTTITA